MLEQAVYAGRNHTAILAVALATVAGLASSAHAQDVGRVGLGSEIESLVAGPDGGAWVGIDRGTREAIGRAGPADGFRTTPVEETLTGTAALGPDGQAWFAAPLGVLLRADAGGTVTRFGPFEESGEAIATGPDLTLWAASADASRLIRVTSEGVASSSPFTRPRCRVGPSFAEMERAADGAMWIADIGCGNLIRLAPDGSRATFELSIQESPDALAADAAGGVWFTERTDPIVGHADARGLIRRVRLAASRGAAIDVAVAPDGSAWFAFGRCFLGRMAPGGPLEFRPAPIPARKLAFDPGGGLWLASAARLVHNSAAGACDETPPRVRLRPDLRRSISLAALRRGIRIEVREPSFVATSVFYDFGADGPLGLGRDVNKALDGTRGGVVTYRVPAGRLRSYERALAAGRRPDISFFVFANDRDGNVVAISRGDVRVTR